MAIALLWTISPPGCGSGLGLATFSWHYQVRSVCVTQGLMAVNHAAKAIFWFQFNFTFACGLDSRMFILT